MVRLEAAGIHVEATQVTLEELNRSIDDQKSQVALEYGSAAGKKTELKQTDPADSTLQKTDSAIRLFRNGPLALRKMMGMPDGFTLWVDADEGKAEAARKMLKKTERNASIMQAMFASVSVALAFYLKDKSSHYMTSAVVVAAWVYFNMYYARVLNIVMNQTYTVTQDKPGHWKVTSGAGFFSDVRACDYGK
jgi:hypothetical protein